MADQPDVDIRFNAARTRFEAPTEGGIAVLEFRKIDDETLEFSSTRVPPEARGQGIAGELVRHGLDWARDQGYRVIPRCSYVASWIEEHPEYEGMVAER